jgi:hypothetical protein
MRGLDDIRLNREIIEQEIGWIRVVGKDSANLGGGEDDNIWLGPGHPLPDGLLLAQIDINAIHGQDFHVFRGEATQDSRADHAAMARDPDSPLGPGIGREVSHEIFLRSGRVSSSRSSRSRPFPTPAART